MSRRPPLLITGVSYHGEVTDLLVSGGVVIPTPEATPADVLRIDARGLIATPGPLTDIHVHFRDPGLTEKEDLISGAQAAAAGGFSLVACEPNTRPCIDTAEAVEAFRTRVSDLHLPVSVFTKAAVTVGQHGEALTDFAALLQARPAAFSDDGEPLTNHALLVQAFRESARLSKSEMCLTAHCEETPGSASRVQAALGAGTPLLREPDLIRLHLAALTEAGMGKLHVQHVSLAESVDLITAAKRQGLAVTAEVTPHHLLLCEDDIVAGDANWKMNPPLRTRQDMLTLRRALADGIIDVIATDHAPHTEAEKSREWDEAPFGIIGLETALGACLTLVHDGTLTWDRLIDAMVTQPRNVLASWSRNGADSLALIDPDHEWVVDPDHFYSKARNCPFAGRRFRGKAIYTIARGRLVMAEAAVLVKQ